MRHMKKYEIELLAKMREDGRMTLTNLSKKLKVPISTLYDRLQQQKRDVFKKITVMLNFDAIGMTARATVILKVHRDHKDALCSRLKIHPHINSLYKINNGYDFMIDVVFPHIRGLEDFMSDLKDEFKIKQSHVYYVINDIKEEAFLSGDPEPLMT